MSATDRRDSLDAGAPGDTLLDVLRKHGRNLSLELCVSMPATVVSYDATTQTATVTFGFLSVEDRGGPVDVPDPPIVAQGVPVAWLGTSTDYVTTPLLPGATGLVIFADRALDEWKRKGGAVDPIDGRTHSLADGVFLPSPLSTPGKIATPTDATAVVVEGTMIKLGRTATDFVALASLVLAEINKLYTHALTHTHPHPMGPTGVAVPPPTATASVAATKVQAI